MSNIKNMYIVIFLSYNQSVLLYRKLKEKNYEVELISTPCSLSSGCSQSIKFEESYLESVKAEIKKNSISIKAIYIIKVKNGVKSYELVKDSK